MWSGALPSISIVVWAGITASSSNGFSNLRRQEAVFNEYIERAGVEVWYESRILSAAVTDGMIRSIRLETSVSPSRRLRREVRAKVYIDCSYEGDLMARAGVGYSVGREDNGRYGETYNGVQLVDRHQFPDGIDPYAIEGDSSSGPSYGISPEPVEANGTADRKAAGVQLPYYVDRPARKQGGDHQAGPL